MFFNLYLKGGGKQAACVTDQKEHLISKVMLAGYLKLKFCLTDEKSDLLFHTPEEDQN